MPTVCVIGRRFPVEEKDISDGGTLHLYVVVRELLRNGYKVEVFTRDEGDEKKVTELPGLRIFRIPFARSSKDNVLARDYEEGKSFIDGVVTHSAFHPETYTCIHTHHWTNGVGLESRIQGSVKLIHTPHLLACEKANYNNIPFPSEVRRAEQSLLNRSGYILALSQSEKAAICTTYDVKPSKVIIAPNGIDDAFFEVSSPVMNEPSMLSIGRICRQKGIDILLDATERIVEQDIPVRLHLVGGNYAEPDVDQMVEQRLGKTPLSGVVERLGRVTHDRILSLLEESPVYVQSSRYESQGIALLEAMAAGRAVIASNLPAVSEYIQHGKNGLLVEPENTEMLAKAMRTLLINSELSQELGLAARETAKAFTWGRMMQIILPLYKK